MGGEGSGLQVALAELLTKEALYSSSARAWEFIRQKHQLRCAEIEALATNDFSRLRAYAAMLQEKRLNMVLRHYPATTNLLMGLGVGQQWLTGFCRQYPPYASMEFKSRVARDVALLSAYLLERAEATREAPFLRDLVTYERARYQLASNDARDDRGQRILDAVEASALAAADLKTLSRARLQIAQAAVILRLDYDVTTLIGDLRSPPSVPHVGSSPTTLVLHKQYGRLAPATYKVGPLALRALEMFEAGATVSAVCAAISGEAGADRSADVLAMVQGLIANGIAVLDCTRR